MKTDRQFRTRWHSLHDVHRAAFEENVHKVSVVVPHNLCTAVIVGRLCVALTVPGRFNQSHDRVRQQAEPGNCVATKPHRIDVRLYVAILGQVQHMDMGQCFAGKSAAYQSLDRGLVVGIPVFALTFAESMDRLE
jgi:hypothetical protein